MKNEIEIKVDVNMNNTILINGVIFNEKDILQLLELVTELNNINEELNSKCLAFDAYVKNGDAKLRIAQRYISQLETLNSQLSIENQQYQNQNWN